LRRALVALTFLALLVGSLFLAAGSGSWFDMPRAVPGDHRALPQWVIPGEVRASTRDGTLVKVRVALDAGTSSNKSALQYRLSMVAQLIEVSVGVLNTRDLLGAQGIRRLAAEVLARVNEFLQAEGLEPLNEVAVQDLWYTRPEGN